MTLVTVVAPTGLKEEDAAPAAEGSRQRLPPPRPAAKT